MSRNEAVVTDRAADTATDEMLCEAWAGHVADYLRLRRSLGFTLAWDEHLLGQFTTDLARSGASILTVTDAVAWAGALPVGQTRRPLTRASVRLTAVRGFATYLHSLDPAHQIPPRGVFGRYKTRPAPYIYTSEEIGALLNACGRMIRHGRRELYPVLFGLIAATGLRVGEALGLDVDEVDLQAGVLTITHAKTRTPRLVPLHPTTTEALRLYAETIAPTRRFRPRTSTKSDGQTDAAGRFFTLPDGGPLPRCNVEHAFRQVTTWTGIRTEQVRPRIHDLRHSFAVNTLLGWYRDGLDVAARLPVLSTYLGHTHPAHTYWYLTATPELLTLAAGLLSSGEQSELAEGASAS